MTAAALPPRSLRGGEHFAEDRFVLHGDVAVLVGGRAAQERTSTGNGL